MCMYIYIFIVFKLIISNIIQITAGGEVGWGGAAAPLTK
jgi:hypothetical protein